MAERPMLDGRRGLARRWAMAGGLVAACLTGPAQAACDWAPKGINLVPLPTGWYQGASELEFPGENHIAYYKRVGMDTIRLPLVWETLQPTLMGELNLRYLSRARDFIAAAQAQGLTVMLDLHNYGRYRNQLIGSPEVPAAAFEDVWKRIATAFAGNAAVTAYGLMNEPHDTGGLWAKVAQSGVDGVRAVDSARWIVVGGDGWSHSQTWARHHPQPFVSDPARRIVYDAHLYLDDDYSGRYRSGAEGVDVPVRMTQRLQPFLDWLRKYDQRGVIGEFGVPSTDPRWLPGLDGFLDQTAAQCVGWFLWAGGRWRDSYELSLEPMAGVDRPQVQLLRQKLSPPPGQKK